MKQVGFKPGLKSEGDVDEEGGESTEEDDMTGAGRSESVMG